MDSCSMSWAVGMSRTSAPPTRTVPEPASQNRATSRAMVVLPDPDGPTIAHMERAGTRSDTPSSTLSPVR